MKYIRIAYFAQVMCAISLFMYVDEKIFLLWISFLVISTQAVITEIYFDMLNRRR